MRARAERSHDATVRRIVARAQDLILERLVDRDPGIGDGRSVGARHGSLDRARRQLDCDLDARRALTGREWDLDRLRRLHGPAGIEHGHAVRRGGKTADHEPAGR